jgi:hypothetical protein
MDHKQVATFNSHPLLLSAFAPYTTHSTTSNTLDTAINHILKGITTNHNPKDTAATANSIAVIVVDSILILLDLLQDTDTVKVEL